MPAFTSDQGLEHPVYPTDPPDGAAQILAALLTVEPRLAKWYADAADRDNRIVSPSTGQLAWLDDVELWTTYKTGGWKLAGSGTNQSYGPGAPSAITGSGTAQIVNTLTVPAAGWDRLLHVTAGCYVAQSIASDNTDIKLLRNGVLVPSGGTVRVRTELATPMLSAPPIALASGTSVTLALSMQRQAGAGTWTSSADVNLNHIDVLAVPA